MEAPRAATNSCAVNTSPVVPSITSRSCRRNRRTGARRRRGLPHRCRQPAFPGPIPLTEAAITVSVRMRAAMLLPQQLQRHARTAQLAMDNRPVGCGRRSLAGSPAAVETALQRLVAHLRRQRPAKANTPCSTNTLTGRRALTPRLAAILRFDRPPALSRSTSRILRMSNLCPGIPVLSKGAEPMPIEDHPTVLITPVHSLSRSPGTVSQSIERRRNQSTVSQSPRANRHPRRIQRNVTRLATHSALSHLRVSQPQRRRREAGCHEVQSRRPKNSVGIDTGGRAQDRPPSQKALPNAVPRLPRRKLRAWDSAFCSAKARATGYTI